MKLFSHSESSALPHTVRRNKRAKRLRLAVYGDGRVVMTVPTWIGQSVIDRFIADKSEWVREKLHLFKAIAPKTGRRLGRRDYLARKEEARVLVEAKVRHFNAVYGFPIKSISIRNQRTRWGSCSNKKNLSINFRIVFLPEHLQDYLIVHELCHLRELNHSPRFWALIAETLPDYRTLKKELRQQALAHP